MILSFLLYLVMEEKDDKIRMDSVDSEYNKCLNNTLVVKVLGMTKVV